MRVRLFQHRGHPIKATIGQCVHNANRAQPSPRSNPNREHLQVTQHARQRVGRKGCSRNPRRYRRQRRGWQNFRSGPQLLTLSCGGDFSVRDEQPLKTCRLHYTQGHLNHVAWLCCHPIGHQWQKRRGAAQVLTSDEGIGTRHYRRQCSKDARKWKRRRTAHHDSNLCAARQRPC